MKAIYHQSGKDPIEMEVKNHNKEKGTADLFVDGKEKVSDCLVSNDGKPGTCTIAEDKKPEDKKPTVDSKK